MVADIWFLYFMNQAHFTNFSGLLSLENAFHIPCRHVAFVLYENTGGFSSSQSCWTSSNIQCSSVMIFLFWSGPCCVFSQQGPSVNMLTFANTQTYRQFGLIWVDTTKCIRSALNCGVCIWAKLQWEKLELKSICPLRCSDASAIVQIVTFRFVKIGFDFRAARGERKQVPMFQLSQLAARLWVTVTTALLWSWL